MNFNIYVWHGLSKFLPLAITIYMWLLKSSIFAWIWWLYTSYFHHCLHWLGTTMIFQMASMKQEKDARIIVLALAAPGTKFKPPQTRKRNKASSSNHAKLKRASNDGPSSMWSWIFVIECSILAKKKSKKRKMRGFMFYENYWKYIWVDVA